MEKRIMGKLVVLVCALVVAASATPITNGSFETCTGCGTLPPPAGYINFGTGATNIDGWSVVVGNIDLVYKTFWNPADGDYSIDLNGLTSGGIQTTLSVLAGTPIQLSWYGGMDPNAYLVGAKGSVSGNLHIFDSGTGTAVLDQNVPFQINYTASGSVVWQLFTSGWVTPGTDQITIAFSSLEPAAPAGSYGPLLDNVTYDVGNVPEPGTLSLLAGAGLVGLALLRGRKK
jgi:hypothetical protein